MRRTGEASAFSEQLSAIRTSAAASTRFVLVTATVPQPVFEELTQSQFPGMAIAIGPRLHRPPAGAEKVTVLDDPQQLLVYNLPEHQHWTVSLKTQA